ncbi:MAG TPA: hypothetical protein VEC56_07940 [Candidatus Krumholzibacteria bacterium]|nr:hypothetical protein [Candidatus Krumholzibacteria bacterium]
MVTVMSLWLPILVSAVVVFIASSIVHMVLKYHANDFAKIPNEDAIMDALRKFNIPQGEYCVPRADSMKAMKEQAFVDKLNKGPVLLMTILPNGPFNMGKSLGLWFGHSVIVSVFAAYIAGRALGPGSDYLDVFRFAGTVAFVGYTLGVWQGWIWYKRKTSTVIKLTIDGLVYGLCTGGVFGAMWPGM